MKKFKRGKLIHYWETGFEGNHLVLIEPESIWNSESKSLLDTEEMNKKDIFDALITNPKTNELEYEGRLTFDSMNFFLLAQKVFGGHGATLSYVPKEIEPSKWWQMVREEFIIDYRFLKKAETILRKDGDELKKQLLGEKNVSK
jgi:hypothetical protein